MDREEIIKRLRSVETLKPGTETFPTWMLMPQYQNNWAVAISTLCGKAADMLEAETVK